MITYVVFLREEGATYICYKCTTVYRRQVSPSFELGNKLCSLTVERDHILQILANLQNKLSKIHQCSNNYR